MHSWAHLLKSVAAREFLKDNLWRRPPEEDAQESLRLFKRARHLRWQMEEFGSPCDGRYFTAVSEKANTKINNSDK